MGQELREVKEEGAKREKMCASTFDKWEQEYVDTQGDGFSFPHICIRSLCEKFIEHEKNAVKSDGYLREARARKRPLDDGIKSGRRTRRVPFVKKIVNHNSSASSNSYEAERTARILHNRSVMLAMGIPINPQMGRIKAPTRATKQQTPKRTPMPREVPERTGTAKTR